MSADSLLTEPAGKLKKLEWVAIPSPGVIPDPGIKLESPALQADSLPAELPGKTGRDNSHLMTSSLQSYCQTILLAKKSHKSNARRTLDGNNAKKAFSTYFSVINSYKLVSKL